MAEVKRRDKFSFLSFTSIEPEKVVRISFYSLERLTVMLTGKTEKAMLGLVTKLQLMKGT